MDSREIKVGGCRFEILTDGHAFVGLGKVWIGETLVRSGRLPIRPAAQTFTGLELAELWLLGVERKGREARIRLKAVFTPMFVKLMRDHSFDPIHETGDWDVQRVAGEGRLTLVLRPARDRFNGVPFAGFRYHYEYASRTVPLFYLLDRASWELDGDVVGATAISQSSCSAPVATFRKNTAWTTEGIIHWADAGATANPVMTHNLPRWASHQAFDFQYKGGRTLIGVFERVDLIRTLLQREPGKAELKCFDKHIFDQALRHATTPKKILLNTDPKTEADQRNVWTWIIQDVHARARAEFGLAEEPFLPWLSQNHWGNFNFDSYYKDLIPAAASIGARGVFIDNVNKSAMTEQTPHPGVFSWNMCCGHEYEISEKLGGAKMLRHVIDRCRKHGIDVFSWTNNDQALSSPLNASERDEQKQWYVKMEDTRLKYGGAYTNVFSIWDFASPGARRNWIDSLKRNKARTGLSGYLFDSFYNLGFMPVNYSNCEPTVMWRQTLSALKELQDAGVHFKIESFGPFGCVQHGCPTSYNIDNIFACYKVGLGSGYTTVPTARKLKETLPSGSSMLYYVLAHMANPNIPLFVKGQRIDEVWTAAHRQALADYNDSYAHLHRRYLQDDDRAVVWHDKAGRRATVFNLVDRRAGLPGRVTDLTTGETLPRAKRYRLRACHTYAVTGVKKLPVAV